MKRHKLKLERLGSTGAVLAAAACPICFPKLAAIGTLFGLGVLAPFEVYFLWGAQLLVGLALAGRVVSFRTNRRVGPMILSVFSAVSFFVSLYLFMSEILSYFALAGILLASFWSLLDQRTRVAQAPRQIS